MQKVQYEPPTCVIQAMSQDSALLAGSPGKFDQVSDAEQLESPHSQDSWMTGMTKRRRMTQQVMFGGSNDYLG